MGKGLAPSRRKVVWVASLALFLHSDPRGWEKILADPFTMEPSAGLEVYQMEGSE